MNLAPWLCLSGDELGNALRTLTYLRRGLGSQWVDIPAPNGPTYEEVSYYSDVYDDEYHAELVVVPYAPADLACYCAALDEGPYVSPADDDAPWYDANRPESGEFLGLVPTSVVLVPTVRRAATATGRGSVIGPSSATGMVVAVRADMHASSPAGMQWGERWLAEVLGDGLCDDRLDLEVLLACPAEAEAAAFRTLPDVGLVDGPTYQPLGDVPDCHWQQVAFQLASASPWLLGEAETTGTLTLLTGTDLYAPVSTDTWTGTAGIRVEVIAGPLGIDELVIEGLVGTGGTCPPDAATPCWAFTAAIPAGHRLVVDGATEEAYIENPATGEIIAGLDALDYDGTFVFPSLGACSEMCVHLVAGVAGAGSSYEVSHRLMEL